MGLDPSLGSGPYKHICLKVDEAKVVMADAKPEPKETQDPPKDQWDELIKINLVEEWRSAQPFFISASLSLKQKTTVLL